jgi:hypothetical protein
MVAEPFDENARQFCCWSFVRKTGDAELIKRPVASLIRTDHFYSHCTRKSQADLCLNRKTSAGDKNSIARSIEREALATDPAVPVVNIRVEEEVLRQVLFLERTLAFLSSAFGALALVLACVGIYGTIACTVAQRTKELGIRIALGAEEAKILTMVLRETLLVVGAGLLVVCRSQPWAREC